MRKLIRIWVLQEVVWERLRDVHGNNEFVRADFTCPNTTGSAQLAFTDSALSSGKPEHQL